MAKLISTTYGNALFEEAVDGNKVDDYLEECQVVRTSIESNPDFLKLMNHPRVDKNEKVNMIETIYKGELTDEMVGWMCLMVEKDRFYDIMETLDYVIAQIKEYKNIGTAIVSTALPLSEIQQKQVEKRLLDTTKYVDFDITYTVDPTLIGGMTIRIKDRVVDSSIKTKLAEMSRELSKIQLKVGECAP